MFKTRKELEKYNRDNYTMAENLYLRYMEMRKTIKGVENLKYSGDIDSFENNEDFKQGFIAGVKIMSAIFMDM